MRIALVVFGDLGDRSGGFRYDYHLVRVLERRGHTVRVVSQPDGVAYRRQPRLARGGWIDEVVGGGAGGDGGGDGAGGDRGGEGAGGDGGGEGDSRSDSAGAGSRSDRAGAGSSTGSGNVDPAGAGSSTGSGDVDPAGAGSSAGSSGVGPAGAGPTAPDPTTVDPAVPPDLILIDELNHAATLNGIPEVRRRLPGVPIVAIIHHLRCDEEGGHCFPPLRVGTRVRERRFLRACDAWVCNSSVTLGRARQVSGVMRSAAVVFPAAREEDPPAIPGIPDVDTGRGAPGTPGVGTEASVHAGVREHSETGPPGGGTEPGASTEAGTPHRPLRIITAGNVIPRKNLHLLIPAVLRSPGMTLDVYGDDAVDPDYTARLRRLAGGASEDRMPEGRRMEGNAGSEDRRIRFHGRVPNEALNRGFAEADLFAMPSSYEGFGIVYLEALEVGVPVLATARGGASEIVTDRDVGVLVQPTRRGITKGLREIAARIRREGDPAAGTGWYHHEKGAGSGAGSGAATVTGGRLPGDACRRRAASFYGWTRTMEGAAWFLEEVSNGRGAPDQTAPGRSTTALGHRSRDTTRRGPFSAAGA